MRNVPHRRWRTLGPQLVVLFGKLVEPLGGRVLLEEGTTGIEP